LPFDVVIIRTNRKIGILMENRGIQREAAEAKSSGMTPRRRKIGRAHV